MFVKKLMFQFSSSTSCLVVLYFVYEKKTCLPLKHSRRVKIFSFELFYPNDTYKSYSFDELKGKILIDCNYVLYGDII